VGALSAVAGKLMLDFIGGAAAAPQPSARWLGLAWGTPTYTGGSEINTSMGYARQSVSFSPAASPQGSMGMATALTFGQFSSVCSILGVQLWDDPTAGAMLFYGTLQTARTLGVGDNLAILPAQLAITLA
jgi:hypothetical protein